MNEHRHEDGLAALRCPDHRDQAAVDLAVAQGKPAVAVRTYAMRRLLAALRAHRPEPAPVAGKHRRQRGNKVQQAGQALVALNVAGLPSRTRAPGTPEVNVPLAK